jgi:hypothetical protein
MRTAFWFLIIVFASFQLAYAGHLDQINVGRLPQNENFLNSLAEMKKLEPFVEDPISEWNFGIDKNDIIVKIRTLYNEIGRYSEKDPQNGELFLYSGLMAHYAYNLDLQEYGKLAEADLQKAKKLMKDDFRPDWFLGMHHIKSQRNREGMEVFLETAGKWEIENGLFWEDYAMSAYFSQMLQNVVMALDKAREIYNKDSEYEELFGRITRDKFIVPMRNSAFETQEIWTQIKSESKNDFISFPLGYRISIPSDWKVQPLPYKSGTAGLNIEIEPIRGIEGDVLSTIIIFAYVPDKNETFEDFMRKFMKPDCDMKKYDLNLGLNEFSYICTNRNIYAQEGGARILMVYFEREEPKYKGVKLEGLQEIPDTTGNFTFYDLTKDRVFSRFDNKLYYLVILDSCESIFEKSLSEFNRTLKSFVVE